MTTAFPTNVFQTTKGNYLPWFNQSIVYWQIPARGIGGDFTSNFSFSIPFQSSQGDPYWAVTIQPSTNAVALNYVPFNVTFSKSGQPVVTFPLQTFFDGAVLNGQGAMLFMQDNITTLNSGLSNYFAPPLVRFGFSNSAVTDLGYIVQAYKHGGFDCDLMTFSGSVLNKSNQLPIGIQIYNIGLCAFAL